MTDGLHTVVHSLENLFHTSCEVAKTGLDVAYTFVWGLLLMLWNTLESFAQFLGASVNFVISNIVILIVVCIGLVVYGRRAGGKSKPRRKPAKQAG